MSALQPAAWVSLFVLSGWLVAEVLRRAGNAHHEPHAQPFIVDAVGAYEANHARFSGARGRRR